jgi:hypothetical protein
MRLDPWKQADYNAFYKNKNLFMKFLGTFSLVLMAVLANPGFAESAGGTLPQKPLQQPAAQSEAFYDPQTKAHVERVKEFWTEERMKQATAPEEFYEETSEDEEKLRLLDVED